MPSFGREVKLWVPCRIFTARKKSPAVVVEVVTDRAKLAGHSRPKSFPPSLTEGSVRPEQSVASPGGGGPRAQSGFGAVREIGRTLRAIWGRPTGCRGLGQVDCPPEMKGERNTKRRTKGRAT
jgi:hypothetical protein